MSFCAVKMLFLHTYVIAVDILAVSTEEIMGSHFVLQGNPGYLQICIQSLHALMDPRLHRSAASRRLTWVYFNWIEYVNVVHFFCCRMASGTG